MSDSNYVLVDSNLIDRLFYELSEVKKEVKRLHWEKEMPEVMTADEVAKKLRLSRRRVYELVEGLKLKAVQHTTGGKLTFHRKDVIRYIQTNQKSLG